MSKYEMRVSPAYQAMPTGLMAASVPRSYWIHWPSPDADQRVARLLSRVFWGTLSSFALALTETTESAESSEEATTSVRGLWGGCGLVRSPSHARAKATLTADDAFMRASRFESLKEKGIFLYSSRYAAGSGSFDRA